MKRVQMYSTANGRVPFREWLENLEIAIQARVTAYIKRVAAGGSRRNIRQLGDGVFEIKIDSGPGYRVYAGEIRGVIILLLIGGDKGSQRRDINQAKTYWRQHVQK